MSALSPHRKRQLLSVFLGFILVSTVLGANLVVGVERTALDAETVKDSFAEENVYGELRTQVLTDLQSGASAGGSTNVGGIDAPPMETVAESVLTEEYVRTEVESSVDVLYAYLHGERDDLTMEIDLTPVVDGFAEEYEQWIREAPVADIEPEWDVEGFDYRMANLAASESSFQATREQFKEDQLQRIQERTPRERTREELEEIYDDNRDRIRDEAVSRIESAVADQAPEPLQEPIVGYATVGVDTLVAEDTSYQQYMDEQEQAREPLATAVGEYIRTGVGEEVPQQMDVTEEMGPEVHSMFEQARTLVWLADLSQYLLPIGAILVAGLMGYTARRRSNALWRVGIGVAIAGLVGFVGTTAASTVISGNADFAGSEVPAIATAFLEVVLTTIGTIGAQSLALLVLGVAFVVAGLAVRRDLLPIEDDSYA